MSASSSVGPSTVVPFLIVSPEFERIIQPYIGELSRLGMKATVRVVDSAQYSRRLNTFDFDIVVAVYPQSLTPSNEQRDFWGSSTADTPGGRNYMGIKNPAIDKLIDRVIFAKDREELVAATHALDRVLLWNYYVVPQWYDDRVKIAYWNKFGMPEKQPDYIGVDPLSWWIDPAKEQALKAHAQ